MKNANVHAGTQNAENCVKIAPKLEGVKTLFAFGGFCMMFFVHSAAAADLVVGPGEEVALSDGDSYDAITVCGTLTLSSGTASANTLTIADGPDGYGSVSISGGATFTVSNAVTIAAAEYSSLASDTILDTLSVDDAAKLYAKTFYNESGLTNRISFAGDARLYGHNTGATAGAYFRSGATLLRLVGGTTLIVQDALVNRSLTAPGASLVVQGDGVFEWRGMVNDTERRFSFSSGTRLDFDGTLNLNTSYTDRNVRYAFGDADVFGDNVEALTSVISYTGGSVGVFVGAGVALPVPDVDLSDARVTLSGETGSSMVVGALPNSHSFKANIPAGDLLSLVKTGATEVVVSATTNIPHLVVSEGTLRITEDCVVEDVLVATNATLVADGCTVTLKNGFNHGGKGMAETFQTANGGTFVSAATGVSVIFEPSDSLTGFHFAGGSNIFSRVGIDKKYWRFTFMKTASNLLNLRGLYLFDENGTWINELGTGGYVAPVTNENYTVLADGKYRFFCNSATNVIAKANTTDNQNLRGLRHVFSFGAGNNAFPVLTSPVLNESDPLSWLSVEFALTNGHERATGYNLRYYNQNTYMQTWKVFASDDGEKNWVEVDARNDEIATNPGTSGCTMDGVQYDRDAIGTLGTEYYTFSGYRTDGLVQAAPFALQADGGAAVDLRAYTGGATVNELTVDFSAAEGGTIYGAKLAAEGTVNLVNVPEDPLVSQPLSLAIVDAQDVGNIRKWRITINGILNTHWHVQLDPDGTLQLMKGSGKGLMLIFR